MGTELTDAEQFLAEHQYDSGDFYSTHTGRCLCGEEMSPDNHLPHVAERLAAREQAARADELRKAADDAKPISGYMGTHRWISADELRDRADRLERKWQRENR